MEQGLTVQQQKQLQLITEAKQLVKHKPLLVYAIEQKKIKEYSPEEKEEANGAIITWILALLGISTTDEDGKEMHYLLVDEFISDELGNYSYQEIKEAFKMLIKGDFKDYKAIHKLDCKILAEVIKMYTEARLSQTANYYNQLRLNIRLLEEQNDIPPKEEQEQIVINGCIKLFDYFLEYGESDISKPHLYDYLFEKGFLPTDKEYKDKKMAMAKTILKANIRANKEKKHTTKQVDKIIEQINKGEISAKSMAKKLVLEEYFTQLQKENKHLKEII